MTSTWSQQHPHSLGDPSRVHAGVPRTSCGLQNRASLCLLLSCRTHRPTPGGSVQQIKQADPTWLAPMLVMKGGRLKLVREWLTP